ncbi:TonB-dependent Receptor Plug Domain protein [compost metagenome]
MRLTIILLLLALGLAANAQQQFKVYGLPDSIPISNATVRVQGKQPVTTGNNGQFMLDLPNGNYQLEIRYLGYMPLSLTLSLPSKIQNFYLTPDLNLLQTVEINTGYQTIPRERATGSFVTISNKQLNEQMSTDIISRLEAVANGITVDKRSSSQGNLMIRGLSSINGPREPLIILDNFPYQGELQNINPNDIEQITILKDAAATSIWGSRAGNGVIVLTSKKAKAGKALSVDFHTNVSLVGKPDLGRLRQLSSTDYLALEEFLYGKGFYNSKINSVAKPFLSPMVELLVAKNNGSITAESYAQQLEFLRGGDVRTEFAKLNYEEGVKQQHALSLRGNENKLAWSLSMGYDHHVSSLAAVNDRLSLTTRNTLKLSEQLSLDFGAMYTKNASRNGRADYSDLSTSGFLYPYLRLKDENGRELAIPRAYSLAYLNSLDRNIFADWNYYPLSDYLNNEIKTESNDLLLNAALNYRVLKGLNAKIYYQHERQTTSNTALYGADSYTVRSLYNTYTQVATNGTVTRIVPLGGMFDTNAAVLKAQNLRAQLNYANNWKAHSLDLLAGYEMGDKNTEGQTNRVYGYNEDRLSVAALNYNTLYPNYITKANSFISQGAGFSSRTNRFVSVYANMAYSYQNKYTFSASARKDASNLFGLSTNDKWKPLWSIGAAWNIGEEEFAKRAWVDELKLRASYGFSGNVDLGRSAVTTITGSQTSNFTGGIMSRFGQFANPELRWEKVGTTNVGLDFSVLKRRLSGSIELYQKNATDLYGNSLVDYTALPTPSLIKNVASIRARGLDVSLNSQNTNGRLAWSTQLNFNLYKDEVLEYYQPSNLGANFVGSGITSSPLAGYPVYSVFSYRWAGLDPANGNPLGDVNGVPSSDYAAIINGSTVDDLVYSGPAFPTIFGSMGNTLAYAGFSLTLRLTYKMGYSFGRTSIHYNNLFSSGTGGHPDYANRWQKPGDEQHTQVPSLVYPAVSRRDNFYNGSEVLVERGDHIRLSYVALTYEVKKAWLAKLPFSNIQLQANASNLGVLWRANKLGIDPDFRENVISPSHFYSFGLRCALKN